MPTVYVLTFCRQFDLVYGSTLLFRSLRTGFPTARVVVVDNDSVPDARPLIRAAAAAAGCEFRQLESRQAVTHHAFLARTVRDHPSGTVVVLDPDVMFWDSCEGWHFDGLIAGRVIPAFDDAFSGCLTWSRPHSSFLWIQDVGRLRDAIRVLQHRYVDFDPFTPYMLRCGQRWWRLDTGANLAAALGPAVSAFAARELDSYDHLFCGCHLDLVAASLDPETRRAFEDSHQAARHDYRALRGLWRAQAAFFESRRVEVAT